MSKSQKEENSARESVASGMDGDEEEDDNDDDDDPNSGGGGGAQVPDGAFFICFFVSTLCIRIRILYSLRLVTLRSHV